MTDRNTDTFWGRLFRGVQRLRQRSDWSEFAGPDWPGQIMTTAVTDRFHAKQGRSTGRWILRKADGHLSVYLKRHYRLPWWRGLLAALWPDGGWSPALQEWRHLEWARGQGLPVPAGVAAGEYIGPWGRLQSFLAIEELTDMVPLHEAVPTAATHLSPKDFAGWKRGLIFEMARITRELHRRRWFHKDLYLCHFYVPHALIGPHPCWPNRVHLIDLHRLGHHRLAWQMWQIKDLAQLLYSSDIAGVTPRDRLRFWAAYLDRKTPTRSNRFWAWIIMFKVQLYRRHRRRRRR